CLFTMQPPPRTTRLPYTTLFRSETPEAVLQVSPYLLFTVLLRRAQRDLRARKFTMEIGSQGTLPVFDADAAADLLEDVAVRDYLDRKSTRLNSSHVKISYAVFCL